MRVLWQRAAEDPEGPGTGPSHVGPSREAVVEVTDPDLPYHVLLRLHAPPAKAWRVTSLEVIRPAHGPELRSETLRDISLADYVRRAADQLGPAGAPPLDDTGSGTGVPATAPADVRPSRMDPERLRTVARVYREALASPVPRERLAPTAAVARAFRIDRSVAGRLVARARREGMLNPAMRRQPGEAPPQRPPAAGRR